jgi:hypothetical protein
MPSDTAAPDQAWPRTGRCLCGAVRITAHAAPIAVRTCWCRLCQYLAAGSATVNVIFSAASVSVEGELTDYVCTADSGNVMHRRFCPRCGTPMLSASEARADLLIIRGGVLDARDELKPDLAIWTRAAPAWACFDPSVPMEAGQPAPVVRPAGSQ